MGQWFLLTNITTLFYITLRSGDDRCWDSPEELDHAAHGDQGEQLPVLLPHDGEVARWGDEAPLGEH